MRTGGWAEPVQRGKRSHTRDRCRWLAFSSQVESSACPGQNPALTWHTIGLNGNECALAGVLCAGNCQGSWRPSLNLTPHSCGHGTCDRLSIQDYTSYTNPCDGCALTCQCVRSTSHTFLQLSMEKDVHPDLLFSFLMGLVVRW